MKTRIYSASLVTFILFASLASFGQSRSFDTLKDHFKGTGEVYSFSVGGFLCRTVLNIAGEYEFRDAIKEVHNVRIINIPKRNFRDQSLTVNGFRKVLRDDKFVSLATVRDHGDHVEIYLQQNGNKPDRYFVLIDEPNEVTAIELKGEVDIDKLNEFRKSQSFNTNL